MKISRDWLATFFNKDIPEAKVLEGALTFHSSEVEEVVDVGDDSVLDVKVLPDKASWLLSHRGIAKELATILEVPIHDDPFLRAPSLSPMISSLIVTIDTKKCARYAGALMKGVTVKESPTWLRQRLEAIGQRSINNVVDATNYVMFHLGQPLHAFDAQKLSHKQETYHIGVRHAEAGETVVALTSEEYTLTQDDMLIIDHVTNTPIGIAGVKGGKYAAIDIGTTDLIIESANFDRVSIRKTSQRLKLRTDASTRYENGIVPELVGYGLVEVVDLIKQIAGGTLEGYRDVFPFPRTIVPISVSIEKINSVLGLSLSDRDVLDIMKRFGYASTITLGVLSITPPFERDDFNIPEDVIEEIGRIHGLHHVPSVTPQSIPLTEYNKRFYYAEQVRDTLIDLGFSEIYTSSFRKNDVVRLENALAEDKSYLRSSLRENLDEALARNVLNKDLLGLSHIALFEVGSVFTNGGEQLSLALGVRTGQSYSAKTEDPFLREAIDAIKDALGLDVQFLVNQGIVEINFGEVITNLPEPHEYSSFVKKRDTTYTPFSLYPFIVRDIALWVDEGISVDEIESVLKETVGALLVRLTLFDEYKKDSRTSYAFRLVFQSSDRTLTNEEVNIIMDRVTAKVIEKGWEVR